MASKDELFYREQQARCLRLASGCSTASVRRDMLKLAADYAEAATAWRARQGEEAAPD